MAALKTSIDRARAFEQAGRLTEAEAEYRAILDEDAANIAALNLLGLLCLRQDRRAEAASLIGRALALRPDDVETLANLAVAQMSSGKPKEAIVNLERAVALKPAWAAGWHNLALARSGENDSAGALEAWRRAVELEPGDAAAQRHLAGALYAARDFTQAAEVYRRLAAGDPADVLAWCNLAVALHHGDDVSGAREALAQALKRDPQHAFAWHIRGTLESDAGDDEAAIAAFSRAIEAEPDHVDAHIYRGACRLRLGQFRDGWADYEWRLRQQEGPRVDRGYGQPRWRGENFAGRCLFIHAEQGLGDTIQFLRYLPLVRERGGHIAVEVQPSLLRLAAASPLLHGLHVIPEGTTPPPFDLHCPLLSLPAIFKTEAATIPRDVPYLRADPRWGAALPPRQKRWRWGVAWAGNPRHPADRRRSLPAAPLDRLAELEDVEIVSLQVSAAEKPARLALIEPAPSDMAATAALLGDLDLVVSVDTAVAHLAGSLGMPVWILLARAVDWRWLKGRPDTPWYPSARLFRQPAPGDWASVIAEVMAAWRRLRELNPSAEIEEARAMERAGRWREAEAIYRAVLTAEPRNVPALNLLGILCYRQGRLTEAAWLIRRALCLQPDDPEALTNLGAVLSADGRQDEAIVHFRRAADIQPGNATMWGNLGAALQNAHDFDGARQAFRRTITLRPDGTSYRSMGLLEAASGKNDRALENFTHALALAPDDPESHVCQALTLLRAGRFKEGWAEYEWRLDPRRAKPLDRGFLQPRWRGEKLAGERLLLYAEQGFGDTIHFLRYLPMVRAGAARVIVELQAPLRRLVEASPIAKGVTVVSRGEELPSFDRCCPLASLPGVFATDGASIPSDVPYLGIDPAWPRLLAERDERRRVGLVWAGNPDYANDRNRSLPGTLLDAFTDLPGIEFVSLQKSAAAPPARLTLTDLAPRLDDFAATAGALQQVDLLVSVDTSVAHLAGALNRPCWVMLPLAADWRWLERREDSPWYPSLTLFRQKTAGDWSEVIARIRRRLAAW